MDLTRPSSGHDQAEDPLKIHHPEEEEHHESRASKMFGKVKAKAKNLKNRLTKHGDEQDHDVVDEEEDDENEEQEPEKHLSPVNEISNVRSYGTSQPDSLTHPGETNVPTTEEIIPSGTKDSTDYTGRVEPEPLRDATYEHEAPSYPVRTSDVSDREESRETDHVPEKHVSPVNEVPNVGGYRTSQPDSLAHPGETNVAEREDIIPSRTKDSTDYTGRVEPEPLRDATYEHEAPSYPVRPSDVSEDREESRETDHVPLKTPVSLLSATEDETTPGEDGLLGGQREVNTDTPKRFEDDLSGESTYQSKIPYHTRQGSGEDDHKSGLGTELETEPGNGKDSSPVRFGVESETELGKDLPTRTFESEIGNDSPTFFGGKQETGSRDDFDQKFDSRIGNNDGENVESERGEDFPAKSHEFEQTIGSGIGEDNGAGKQGTERREDFLGKTYEFDQEIESAFGKDSPTRLPGDDESIPTRSDDMKVETGLGRDLPTETDDHFSPEFSGPKERDDFDSQEVKPTTYSEMIGSPTDKVTATKDAVASGIGYSSEFAGGQQHESPMGVETVADKLATDDENVKKTDEAEQGEDRFVPARDHLEEKLTPEEKEDRAFSDMVAEKLDLGGEKQTTTKEKVDVEKIPSDKLPEEIEGGEAVHEEEKGGGGIVGTIKGVYSYWVGGTEEVKPKSPSSGEESAQPLSSNVGGAAPVQKGI